MRHRLLMLGAALFFSWGCRAWEQSDSRPATVYAEGEEAQGQAADKKEPAAVQAAQEPTRAGGNQESPDASSRKESQGPADPTGLTPKPDQKQSGLAATELTAEYLVRELESKPSRTPAEEEAYRRLLGIIPEPQPPAEGGDIYGALGSARDAVVRADFEAAQGLLSRAIVRLRSRNNPVIESIYFATQVKNYGNADIISPAEFTAGQRVLLVTDLSSFTCEPADAGVPPRLYRTKMSQRIAIYDSGGNLVWQNSYEAQEYQSAHYVWTMFIPQIFNLPADLRAGEYIAKVEIVDAIANRQTESGTKFTVK